MDLYNLIYKATILNDDTSVWELIHKFDPLLKKYSLHPETNCVDDDLLSIMKLQLFRRIKNFKI